MEMANNLTDRGGGEQGSERMSLKFQLLLLLLFAIAFDVATAVCCRRRAAYYFIIMIVITIIIHTRSTICVFASVSVAISVCVRTSI